jgi:hypothetical protein
MYQAAPEYRNEEREKTCYGEGVIRVSMKNVDNLLW